MYADPQSVTVNAVAKSLARIGTSTPDTRGSFKTAEGDFDFEIRQFKSKDRMRHEARLTQRKVSTDPVSAIAKEVSGSVIIAVDEPKWGFSDTELGYLTAALVTWFSNANRDKLLAGEA